MPINWSRSRWTRLDPGDQCVNWLFRLVGVGWILLDAEEEQEEVVRLRPVRCERVRPAHGWVNQSPAEPQSLTEPQTIVNTRSRTTEKLRQARWLQHQQQEWQEASASLPQEELSVQVSGVTRPQTGLTKPQQSDERKKHHTVLTEDNFVPKLLMRNFSYVATVCDPSDNESNVLSDSLTLWTQFSLRD